jgi:exopolysaccharide biosynthesis polyprenyl glycosylphosphotransferase
MAQESLLFSGGLNHRQVFALMSATFGLISVGRILTRAAEPRTTTPERLLIVGSTHDCDRAARIFDIGLSGGTNAIVVGQVRLGEDTRQRGSSGGDLPELYDVIADTIVDRSVERVILAPDGCGPDELLDLIRLIDAVGVKLSVVPRLLDVVGPAYPFDELDRLSLLGVRPHSLTRPAGQLKRAIDLVAAVALLTAIAPLLGAIALGIKLDSQGPVFFRQRRIGRGGRAFDMIKFRSMVPDAEAIKPTLRAHNEAEGGLFKITEDPRITRVGRLLRRISLDELPQLLNVVRGEMSLVGPRPLVPDEDALIEGWRRRRLAVRPGMTGVWQISGSSKVPMHEMVKLDYMYAVNWSLWLDLKILIRTVPYVIGRQGV